MSPSCRAACGLAILKLLRKNVIFPMVSLALMLGVTACRTSNTMPAMDFSGQDWSLTQGQVLWQINRRQALLAADFLLATNRSGDFKLALSKNPLPLADAGLVAGHWWIHYGAGSYSSSGTGHVPAHFSLFLIAPALEGRPVEPPWRFSWLTSSRWRLQNPITGESLEGINLP